MRDNKNKGDRLNKFQIMDKREIQVISKEQYEKMLENGEITEETYPSKKDVDK